MIKAYTGIKGLAILLFFMAAAVLFLSIFFWGITKAIGLILPLLIVLAYLLIIVFVLGVLPATFLKHLRPSLCVYSAVMSQALGVTTWMMCFFFVIKTFGWAGVFLAFLFQFLAPLALVGAMLKGSWHTAVHLSLWISFAYGMKFYGQWLLSLNQPKQDRKDIIDVDAIEVRSH